MLLLLQEMAVVSYLEADCGSGGTYMLLTEFLRAHNGVVASACIDTPMKGNSITPYDGLLDAYLTDCASLNDTGMLARERFVGTTQQYVRQRPMGPLSLVASAADSHNDGMHGHAGVSLVVYTLSCSLIVVWETVCCHWRLK